jgi:hypothetical protein
MLQINSLQNVGTARATIPNDIIMWLANTPPDLLPAEINVAIVDELCAYMDPGSRYKLNLPGPEEISVGGKFADIIPALLLIAAPAGPVKKMSPHPGDGFTGNLDGLLNTWTPIFRRFNHQGHPDWSNVEISGMERTEMYDYIGKEAHFIIRTRETEGWANVVLKLNLRELSQMIKGILEEYRSPAGKTFQQWSPVDYSQHPVTRGSAMQKYGHGNGLLFASPQALEQLSIDLIDHPHCTRDNTVKGEFEKASELWSPDTYPKHENSPLQNGIGTLGVGGDELVFPDEWLVDPLGNRLTREQLQQELAMKELNELLEDPRQVYITVCQAESGEKAVFFSDGISGANGGIGG